MQAICNKCNRLNALEVCFECNSALCRTCCVSHFEAWKYQKGPFCYEAQVNVENCKRKLDMHANIVSKNLDQVKQIQDQIEETYNATIQKLNQEKTELINVLNDVKKDNSRFVDFKKRILQIDQNLSSFKDSTDNLYEDNAIKSLVKKFEENYEQSQKINSELSILLSSPLKAIERFDRVPPPRSDVKLIGQMKMSQSVLAGGMMPQETFREGMKLLATQAPTTIFPSLPTAQLTRMNVSEKSSNFSTWKKKAEAEPYLEIDFDRPPSHLASCRNYMFSVDDQEMLSIFTISSTNEIKLENNLKMPYPPNSIAINMDYMAVSYTNLNKKYLKNKKSRPTGVSLFKRDLNIVDFNLEKAVELPSDTFKNPIGIALSNDHLFVCDKDLRAVFKIDIKTNMLVKRVELQNGEPYKISINKNYVVVTDTLRHSLNIYEIETMALLKDTVIEAQGSDGKHGPFTVSLTDDNLIFIKNYPDKQLMLFNFDLTDFVTFKDKRVRNGIQGFTLLQCSSLQTLVVGTAEKKGVYKLICFANA